MGHNDNSFVCSRCSPYFERGVCENFMPVAVFWKISSLSRDRLHCAPEYRQETLPNATASLRNNFSKLSQKLKQAYSSYEFSFQQNRVGWRVHTMLWRLNTERTYFWKECLKLEKTTTSTRKLWQKTKFHVLPEESIFENEHIVNFMFSKYGTNTKLQMRFQKIHHFVVKLKPHGPLPLGYVPHNNFLEKAFFGKIAFYMHSTCFVAII